eukprot:scaffold28216_cov31-Tisochrysis_lutea.AAC.4
MRSSRTPILIRLDASNVPACSPVTPALSRLSAMGTYSSPNCRILAASAGAAHRRRPERRLQLSTAEVLSETAGPCAGGTCRAFADESSAGSAMVFEPTTVTLKESCFVLRLRSPSTLDLGLDT